MAKRRESYIPIRKASLLDALAKTPGLDDAAKAKFAAAGRLLGALLHHRAFERLEALKALYDPFDPDAALAEAKGDKAALLQALEAMLARAAFEELSIAQVLVGRDLDTLQDVRIKHQDAGIGRVRFFVRGARPETVVPRRWWGLVKKKVGTEIYDDLVVIAELKPPEAFADEKEVKRFARLRRGARAGAILLRHFGDTPRTDLASLHPGAEPTMKRRDQLILGVPAVAGGAPLLLQLANAAPIIFVTLAAAFGVQGALTQDRLQHALAALSGIVALGAFLMRQRLKFNAQRLDYQKKLSDTVYFHTIANNAGMLDGLMAAAEQQDLKEALIAWRVLLSAGPLTRDDLDKACEAWLADRFALSVDFEIGDALNKLIELGLVRAEGDRFAAIGAAEGLQRLDGVWDAEFAAA
jgi:hypothetical protein